MKRPKLRIGEEYIVVNGQKELLVDPMKTSLPDRFKLILAELATGQKYELVNTDKHTK